MSGRYAKMLASLQDAVLGAPSAATELFTRAMILG